ncbi:ATP-grasp domain-containing protein [Paraburkholderia edwinii]|uniref:ATP-grasp domain-containing protein n=1 Tax=Paraburkholderia edwinii TaxID=2861782 RepID=A0ABX8UVS6_9BURK|nr:ATP-grasp domain-containing protein [Paraburkholderia edwinii]QYD73098.1 ATP-grasp domain-containing protein [Paraburkholderia edwinii]
MQARLPARPSSARATARPYARAYDIRVPFVAIAGLSARLFTESAAQARLNVAALDLFGDRDTRQRAKVWLDVGGEGLSMDRDRLFDALARVARLPRMLGLIAGSGLEPFARELHERTDMPRFIGNDMRAIDAVREPGRFFALLDELGVEHPEVSFARPPEDTGGWIGKRADGCGGMHIRAAYEFVADGSDAAATPPIYFQRLAPGRSMSALFIAAGGHAVIIGFAEQLTVTHGALPFIHTGSLGPIDLPPPVASRIGDIVQAIVAKTGLVGMNSIDFLLDGDDTISVLEINARPSSTAALYEIASPAAWPHGLLACHIDACLKGRLPSPPPLAASSASSASATAATPQRYVAQRVAFAPHSFSVTQRFSDTLFAAPWCRDVPQPGVRIAAGEPVCTLIAIAAAPARLRDELERQRTRLLELIDTCHESHDDLHTRTG